MRSITHGDVCDAARRLVGLPDDCWAKAVWAALEHADIADRFRKRTGRGHAFWGDGSLSASVRSEGGLVAEPPLSDMRYLEAVAEVIHSILRWRARQIL